MRDRAGTSGIDPALTLTVLGLVAAQRWKRVTADEGAIETGTTLAISWSGPKDAPTAAPPGIDLPAGDKARGGARF